MTELNNVEQSNHDRFISSALVPTRECTLSGVGKLHPVRTRIFFRIGKTNASNRSFLEYRGVAIDQGNDQRVNLILKFAPDNLTKGSAPKQHKGRARESIRRPNEVGCTARIEGPTTIASHYLDSLGGLQEQVATGKSTRFNRVAAGDVRARSRVLQAESGAPANGYRLPMLQLDSKAEPALEYVRAKLRKGVMDVRIPRDAVRQATRSSSPSVAIRLLGRSRRAEFLSWFAVLRESTIRIPSSRGRTSGITSSR